MSLPFVSWKSVNEMQQGMKLIKNCSNSIDRVEKKLIVLENGEE